jgi:hypothetical protein
MPASRLRLAIVGVPSSPRIELFQNALARLGQPPAHVVPYKVLLKPDVHETLTFPAGSLLRLDSPGRDFDLERSLIAIGADVPDHDVPGPPRIPRSEALALPFDRGRIWRPRQWFLGFQTLLHKLARILVDRPDLTLLNPIDDVATMFDKPSCHRRLETAGVPCAPALPEVRSYDDLRHQMRLSGMTRVFIKLRYGSSASGVVALATGPRGIVATTTTEWIAEPNGGVRLYNTRAIQQIRDEPRAARLIDALALEGVHVERWLPKAGFQGRSFDLRVVTIAGRPAQSVVRMANGPITNLHLGGLRSDVSVLRDRLPSGAWNRAMSVCEAAAALFARSLHTGIDLLLAPDFRRVAVLEVNAFGDLLKGIVDDAGDDTYTRQVRTLLSGWRPGAC